MTQKRSYDLISGDTACKHIDFEILCLNIYMYTCILNVYIHMYSSVYSYYVYCVLSWKKCFNVILESVRNNYSFQSQIVTKRDNTERDILKPVNGNHL